MIRVWGYGLGSGLETQLVERQIPYRSAQYTGDLVYSENMYVW